MLFNFLDHQPKVWSCVCEFYRKIRKVNLKGKYILRARKQFLVITISIKLDNYKGNNFHCQRFVIYSILVDSFKSQITSILVNNLFVSQIFTKKTRKKEVKILSVYFPQIFVHDFKMIAISIVCVFLYGPLWWYINKIISKYFALTRFVIVKFWAIYLFSWTTPFVTSQLLR